MKKIIITGSNGQLGRAISRLYGSDSAYELINTDFNVEGIPNLVLNAVIVKIVVLKI